MITIIPNWHPILVHFTIALLSTAILFYLAILLLPNNHRWQEQWLNMANWSLWSGSLFTIATVIAGWFAYNSVAHDEASHAAMTLHRNWAIPTAILFLIIAISAIHLARNKNVPGIRFILVSLIALILLMITGWLGAEAVYRYGLGVMSLPQVETGTEGHNHSHNDEPEVSTLHRHEMVEEQNHAQMQDKKIKMNSSDMTIEVQTEYDHPSQRSNSEISSHQH